MSAVHSAVTRHGCRLALLSRAATALVGFALGSYVASTAVVATPATVRSACLA